MQRAFKKINATEPSPVSPGTYQVFECLETDDCNPAEQAFSNQRVMFMLSQFPTGEPILKPVAHKAFKSKKYNLKPATLTITSIKDDYWPGAGPTKRVKGSFSGTLANIDWDANNNKFVSGPLRTVEGKFDLYTGRLY